MRSLQLQDVFKLSEIVDVMGIEIDLNNLMDKAKIGEEGEELQAKVGGQIALLFVKKIYKAEKQVISFIAGITEDDIETVKKYGIKKIMEFFTGLFNDPEFKSFFKSAVG